MRRWISSEFLGDKTFVYLSLAEKAVWWPWPMPHSLRGKANTVGIQFDPAAAHLFDAEGRNCRRPA